MNGWLDGKRRKAKKNTLLQDSDLLAWHGAWREGETALFSFLFFFFVFYGKWSRRHGREGKVLLFPFLLFSFLCLFSLFFFLLFTRLDDDDAYCIKIHLSLPIYVPVQFAATVDSVFVRLL